MIIEFSVKNFRSINEMQTISFKATTLNSTEENKFVDENNITRVGNTKVLKTLGLYGANASGKSNIIKALDLFLLAIKQDVGNESGLWTLYQPFLFQENTEETESFFQIFFIYKSKKYRYGFTLKQNVNAKAEFAINKKEIYEIISSEWLFGEDGNDMVEIFTRDGMEVNKSMLPNPNIFPALPSPHTLFLTHASAFDAHGIMREIREIMFLFTVSNLFVGVNSFRRFSMLAIYNKKKALLNLLGAFSLNYHNVFIFDEDKKNDISTFPIDKIYFEKSYTNPLTGEIKAKRLNLGDTESDGTQKLFDLVGLLLFTFEMNHPGLIIIDEIDSNFHPSLLIKLVGLFNDPKINKSNSQLLFTSHDTNLMQPNIMRRDQFYFTEKTSKNATKLFSLADLKGIRNDADFAKQYLAGFYGALPILEDYSTLIENNND